MSKLAVPIDHLHYYCYCITIDSVKTLETIIQQRDVLGISNKQLIEKVKQYEQELANAADNIKELEQLLQGKYSA